MSGLCENDIDPVAALKKEVKKKKDAKRKKELREERRGEKPAKPRGRRPKSFEHEDGIKVDKRNKTVTKSKSIDDVPRRTPKFQATGNVENVEEPLRPLISDDPSADVMMDTQESQTVWQERMAKQDEEFRVLRQHFPKAVIEGSHVEESGCCSHCHSTGCVVVCSTCRSNLCNTCDRNLHLKLIDHQRRCLVNERSHIMLPTEFINIENGDLEQLDVYMPVLTPIRCGSCNEIRTLRSTVGRNKTILITNAGRFDISTTAFRCSNIDCNILREATTLEYISSGYWAGSAANSNYFFDEFLLESGTMSDTKRLKFLF